jgi:hypothetical protein
MTSAVSAVVWSKMAAASSSELDAPQAASKLPSKMPPSHKPYVKEVEATITNPQARATRPATAREPFRGTQQTYPKVYARLPPPVNLSVFRCPDSGWWCQD